LTAVPKFNAYVGKCSSEPQSTAFYVPPNLFLSIPSDHFLQAFITKILYEIIISLSTNV